MFSRFLTAIQKQNLNIIVDNTNIHAWEIAPYYRIAEIYDIPVEIVRCECDVWKAISRQRHNVPVETIICIMTSTTNAYHGRKELS